MFMNYFRLQWCSLRDSNPRPPPCDGDALPTELSERIKKNFGGADRTRICDLLDVNEAL